MAQPTTKEDYYMILEVEQTAALQQIASSYKRLALKLHPDKNIEHDTTEAFQKLLRAYETLKDEKARRAYDLIYPSIGRKRPTSAQPEARKQPTSPPQPEAPRRATPPQPDAGWRPRFTSSPQPAAGWRPTFTSSTNSDTQSEAAQIAAIQKSKQERKARWQPQENTFITSIFELQRRIRRLEQEIKNLDEISAAEVEEAQKNWWKKPEDSEEEKERKDRARQERRIEKDMKERRLESNKADLNTTESRLKEGQEKVDAADRGDDEKIRAIQAHMRARENEETLERERMESEMREKRQARVAAKARRKQHARPNVHRGHTGCLYNGWWPKVQGRAECPRCHGVWSYLLECPSCKKKTCPKCQAGMRSRKRMT